MMEYCLVGSLLIVSFLLMPLTFTWRFIRAVIRALRNIPLGLCYSSRFNLWLIRRGWTWVLKAHHAFQVSLRFACEMGARV